MKKHYDYIWLIHPLHEEMRKKYIPFSWWFNKLRTSSKFQFEMNMSCLRPRIVDFIHDPHYKTNCLVTSSTCLPFDLLNPMIARTELNKIRKLIEKKCSNKPLIGLGGFWGSATGGGRLVKKCMPGYAITTGKTATVIRLIDFVEDSEKKVLVLGAGSIGKEVTKRLLDQGKKVLLIDQDMTKLSKIRKRKNLSTALFDKPAMYDRFNRNDIAICCVSSKEKIISASDIPEGFIIIDDSYPSSIPKYPNRIPGGVWTMPNVFSFYTLIKRSKVWGCLAEVIILSGLKRRGVDIEKKINRKNVVDYVWFNKKSAAYMSEII